jgi:anthranilate synthase component 2
VVRNDQITLEEVGKYDKIILSPGPGIPEEAGILLELIKEYAPTKSILGVCLDNRPLQKLLEEASSTFLKSSTEWLLLN